MAKEKKLEGYGLDPAFERKVAVLASSRPKFYGVVGRELEPGRFAEPACRLAVMAAHAHAKDAGHGPSDASFVAQRARRWRAEGKVTAEEVNALVDLLNETEVGALDDKGIATELVPVLQRLMRNEAVLGAIEEYGKGGDFASVEATIRRARTLGTHDRSTGSRLGTGSLKNIARMRQADRLATGILELDMGLGGGLPRGKAGMIVAGAKVGKSFFLTGECAHALGLGLFCVYATLELSEEDVEARLIANLVGLPIDTVVDGSMEGEVQERLEDLLPTLGLFRTKFFPAKITTLRDVTEWIKDVEEEEGRKVDLFALDYVDKLGADDKRMVSEYQVQGQAAEDYRLYCHGRGIWGWTASQPKRRDVKDRARRIEIDDIADSQNKARVMDLIVTMHRPTEEEVEFFVAGNRNGKDKFSVGPLPHNLTCAQLVPTGQP